MKIEDIYAEWDKDKIDQLNIERSITQIPIMHNKYLRWFNQARYHLKELQRDLRVLNTRKWEFLSNGPDEMTPKDWKLPPKGRIIKSEIEYYLDADEDLNNLRMKIAFQEEKVDLLSEIIKQVNARNYLMTNIINHRKFEAGG